MANFLTVFHQDCIKHFQIKLFLKVKVLMMSWSLLALMIMGI